MPLEYDTVIAGGNGSGSKDGPAKKAQLFFPRGLALKSGEAKLGETRGRLVVADQGSHKIREISLEDGRVSTLDGSGTKGCSDGEGDALAATFNCPVSVDIAPDGTVFVADKGNNVVRVIRTDGAVLTVGVPGKKGGCKDGAAAVALFNTPLTVAVDGNGDCLVADEGNHRIRKIRARDLSVGTFFGRGSKPGADMMHPQSALPLSDGTVLVSIKKPGCLYRLIAQDGSAAEPLEVRVRARVSDGSFREGRFPTALSNGSFQRLFPTGGRGPRRGGPPRRGRRHD